MTSKPAVALVWFRDDLRVSDNPALSAALNDNVPVVALYVHDEESAGIRPLGGAAKWWLHYSLTALSASLRQLNVPLLIRRGSAETQVRTVAANLGATHVTWNRRYGSAERALDSKIRTDLIQNGIEVESFSAALLFEPWTICTSSGKAYSVFAPFWRRCLSGPPPREPLRPPAPSLLTAELCGIASLEVDELGLLSKERDWAEGLRATWEPGEAAAHESLQDFVSNSLESYTQNREIPALPGTSQLSPRLRWGELSPHQIWHTVVQSQGAHGTLSEDAAGFLRQLGWREFAWHTLYHFPDLATRNWRPNFDEFPWPRLQPELLAAWQQGRTGFALVDAGMRQLWRTGWMHNRVRMVTASFLCKNLLIDWREGEAWFWDTLVDADLAVNPFNWQWTAGSGADAAPYFRIFNPDLQAKKYDPDALYIRANIGDWGARHYPQPIVDLQTSRTEALLAYDSVRIQRAHGS